MFRVVTLLCSVFLLLAGCGSEAGAGAENLGGEGDSCLRTPDCEAPLHCIENFCAAADGAGGDADAGATQDVLFGVSDATAPRDGPAGVDPGPDLFAQPDLKFPFDVADARPHKPDVKAKPPDVFSDCSGLGIAERWSGTFQGTVDFDFDYNLPGVPSKGTLQTEGDLGFEIKCLEQKLVVVGTLDGFATSDLSSGQHPYAAKIFGDYYPKKKAIDAKLIDGQVNLFGIVGVQFKGLFKGAIQPGGRFEGIWSGEHTGNSLNFTGTADGLGTWKADPSPN